MSVIGKIFSGATSGLVESIGTALDGLITNDEERAKAKLMAKKLIKSHEKSMEEEITKRHKYDMHSDSWLSKNIRPSVLVYSLVMVTAFALSDGNIGEFQIKGAYIDLVGNLLISASLFYFGSRSFDKHTSYKLISKLREEKSKDGGYVDMPKFEKVDVEPVSINDNK